MDLISLMMVMFLNFSDPCIAQKAEGVRIGGMDYLVLSYDCGAHQWRIWQRQCSLENGATFYGRPYYMQDAKTQMAFYVNRFGEIQGGYGAAITESYLPLCGS